MCGVLGIVLLLAMPEPDMAVTAPELEAVRTAIKEQNLPWTAGRTSVSDMPLSRFRQLLISPRVMRQAFEHFKSLADDDNYHEPGIPSFGLPDDLDWRNRQGVSFITPVRDQAQCGSCWAFGTLAAVESLFLLRSAAPFDGTNDVDLSEQDIIDCSDSGGCNGGGTWGQLPRYLESSGVSFESCYPYEAADGTCRASTCKERIFTDSHVPVALLGPLGPDDREIIDRIRAELYWRPIPVSMAVHSDFRFYKSGVYIESEDATIEGYHAVSLVGWEEENQAWIVKNSWGPDWGENGFFRIKYWASGIGSMAMRFEYDEDNTGEITGLPDTIELDADRPDRYRMVKLQNTGGAPSPWTAYADDDWLSISPDHGEVVPGGVQLVKVELIDIVPSSQTDTEITFDFTGSKTSTKKRIQVHVHREPSSDTGGCNVSKNSGTVIDSMVPAVLFLSLIIQRKRRFT